MLLHSCQLCCHSGRRLDGWLAWLEEILSHREDMGSHRDEMLGFVYVVIADRTTNLWLVDAKVEDLDETVMLLDEKLGDLDAIV